MLEALVAKLASVGIRITSNELEDAIWLLRVLPSTPAAHSDTDTTEPEEPSVAQSKEATAPSEDLPTDQPSARSQGPGDQKVEPRAAADVLARAHRPSAGTITVGGVPFRAPAAAALPGAMEIGRALRPLRRRVRTNRFMHLDEEASARRILEERVWVPVLRPGLVRWLEVALVVDGAASMALWHRALVDFDVLLRQGTFRDVRRWTLDSETPQGEPPLYAGMSRSGPVHDARELIDPTGRRLILMVTDGVAGAWRDGRVARLLRAWGARSPTAIIDVLPAHLWIGTAIGDGLPVKLRSREPGATNDSLDVSFPRRRRRERDRGKPPTAFPVVELTATSIAELASLIAGTRTAAVGGVILRDDDDSAAASAAPGPGVLPSAAERVERFESIASPKAQKLAQLLAAAPLSLPVMRLVREVMLPDATNGHVAEVFLGGLVQQITTRTSRFDPDEVEYDFHDGVRDELLRRLPVDQSIAVLLALSRYVEDRLGRTIDFAALLANPSAATTEWTDEAHAHRFATVAAEVLRPLGGKYAALADQLVPAGDDVRARVADAAAAQSAADDSADTSASFLENGLWVLLEGEEETNLSAETALLAENLGRSLALAGYSLVTCANTGVALVAARAFFDVLEANGYVTARHRMVSVLHEGNSFPWGRTLSFTTPVAPEAVRRANAVLRLGTSRHTRAVDEAAQRAGMPIIVLDDHLSEGRTVEQSVTLAMARIQLSLGVSVAMDSTSLVPLLRIAERALDAWDPNAVSRRLVELRQSTTTMSQNADELRSDSRASHRLVGFSVNVDLTPSVLMAALRAEQRYLQLYSGTLTLRCVLEAFDAVMPLADDAESAAITAYLATIHDELGHKPFLEEAKPCRDRIAMLAERDRLIADAINAVETIQVARDMSQADYEWLNEELERREAKFSSMPEAGAWFTGGREPHRAIAIALLLAKPDRRGFHIADSLLRDPRSAHEQYTALRVMTRLIEELERWQLLRLRETVAEMSRGARLYERVPRAPALLEQLSATLAARLGPSEPQPVRPEAGEQRSWNRRLVFVAAAPRENVAELEGFCRAFGGALAEHGFGLITEVWPGADEDILEGYSGTSELPFVRRAEGVALAFRPDTSPQAAVSRLEEAQALVVIGGHARVEESVKTAMERGILVVPLDATGGVASRTFEALRRARPRDRRLGVRDLERLEAKLGSLLVGNVISVLEHHLLGTDLGLRDGIVVGDVPKQWQDLVRSEGELIRRAADATAVVLAGDAGESRGQTGFVVAPDVVLITTGGFPIEASTELAVAFSDASRAVARILHIDHGSQIVLLAAATEGASPDNEHAGLSLLLSRPESGIFAGDEVVIVACTLSVEGRAISTVEKRLFIGRIVELRKDGIIIHDARSPVSGAPVLHVRTGAVIGFTEATEPPDRLSTARATWMVEVTASTRSILEGTEPGSDRRLFERLAGRYDDHRRQNPRGPDRARELTRIHEAAMKSASDRRVDAALIRSLYEGSSETGGGRVIALACCAARPNEASMAFIEDAIRSERSRFEQWAALDALLIVLSVASPLLVEPCIAAIIGRLDVADSLLNEAEDPGRRELAFTALKRFGNVLGLPVQVDASPALIRAWIAAGPARWDGAGRRVVVAGHDRIGAHKELCAAIGRRLADAAWRVAAGSDATVGEVVISACEEAASEARTERFVPAAFPDLHAMRSKMIAEADALLAIAGLAGTAEECTMAFEAGIPVLAVKFTGGAAERVAERMNVSLVAAGVDPELISLLDAPRDERTAAEAIVRILNIAVRTEAVRPPARDPKERQVAEPTTDGAVVDAIHEIQRRVGYWPVWPPGSPLRVGDVGVLEDGVLRRVTSLRALGIHANHTDWPNPDIELSVAMTMTSTAQSVSMSFERAGAAYLKATRVRRVEIDDTRALQAAIQTSYDSRRWNPDWVAVTAVLEAQKYCVLVSDGPRSSAELDAGLDMLLDWRGALRSHFLETRSPIFYRAFRRRLS